MFCPTCGNRVDPGARFCAACGTSLTAAAAPAPAPTSAPPVPHSAPPSPYSAPPGSYSAQPSPYSAPPGSYSAPPSPYSAPPGSYNAPPSPYGAPPAPAAPAPTPYGQTQLAQPPYGQTPYGQTPYGQTPYGPAQPTPNLGYPAKPASATATSAKPALLGGDWAGAVSATLLGLGSILALALLITILRVAGATDDIKASEFISSILSLFGWSVGGSWDSAAGAVTFRPLGLTLVGYGLLANVFVRRLRARPLRPGALGQQAARVFVIHLAALLVLSLLSVMAGGPEGHLGVFSTLLFGTITLAVALLVGTIIGLPGALPEPVEAIRAKLAGPVRGVLVFWLSATALTFVFVVLLIATQSAGQTNEFGTVLGYSGYGGRDFGSEWRGVLGLVIGYLPTIAAWVVLVGLGIPIAGTRLRESVSILDLIDDQPLFWLWPLLVLVLLVFAGWHAARRSPVGANGRPAGWWLAAALPVGLLLLALGAQYRALPARGDVVSMGPGSDILGLLFVVLFGAVVGLAVGLLGTVLVPRQAPRSTAFTPAPR